MRTRTLERLSELITQRPQWVVIGSLVLILASLALLPGLRVSGGHTALAGPDNVHEQRFASFLAKFGSPDLLFVVVEHGTPDVRRRILDQLQGQLALSKNGHAAERSNPVADIFTKLDLQAFMRWALYYLPTERLEQLQAFLADPQLGLNAIHQTKNLADLLQRVNAALEQEMARAQTTTADGIEGEASAALNVLTALLKQIEAAALGRSTPQLTTALAQPLAGGAGDAGATSRPLLIPGQSEQLGIDGEGYLTSFDGTIHLALVRPKNTSDEPAVVQTFVSYVQERVDAALAGLPAADRPTITLTGYPSLIIDETKALQHDLPLTSAISLAGVLLFFLVVGRPLRQALLSLLGITVAQFYTLAFVRLTIGELNMLTSATIPMLIGLGDDFSVHLLARYTEAKREGQNAAAAVRTAILGSGPGAVSGALTIAAAFFVLATNNYRAFQQMSITGAVGLALALIANFTLVPALLVWPRTRWFQAVPSATPHSRKSRTWECVPRLIVAHRGLFLGACLGLSVFMAWEAKQIPWSYNYVDLLPQKAASVKALAMLSEKTAFSSDVAVIRTRSVAEAETIATRLKKFSAVGQVESIATFLPEHSAEKHALLQQIGQISAEPAAPAAAAETALDPIQLREQVQALGDLVEDAQFAAERAGRTTPKALPALVRAARSAEQALAEAASRGQTAPLAALNRETMALLAGGVNMLQNNVNAPEPNAELLRSALPAGLRGRLVSGDEFAVYIYPKGALHTKEQLSTFVHDVREVDPAATGFPITHWEATASIEHGVKASALWAMLALVAIVFFDFRSVRYTILALVPLALGLLWMWGSMRLLGMSYNLSNIFAFPLILGIGINSGIHLLHRFRQEGECDVAGVLRSTGGAIFLSTITTIVAFGALGLADHRGAASMGLTLLLGLCACLVTAMVALPALMAVLNWKRSEGTHVVKG